MPSKHSHQTKGFFKGRFKAVGTALYGAYLLLTTEHSTIVQSFAAIVFTGLGFYYHIDGVHWALHTIVWFMVLSIEALNTAVEKLCDFIHEDYHDKIGFIKDISAGATTFAVFNAIIIELLIYIPILLF